MGLSESIDTRFDRPILRQFIPRRKPSQSEHQRLNNSKRFLYNEYMKTMPETKPKMNCPDCEVRCASFGKHRNGLRRFRCAQCGRTYTEPHENLLGSMTIPLEKAILALRMLLEGSSIRSVERMTELHRDTILKLLVIAGEKCEKIMGRYVRNIAVRDVECDEVWSYLGKKEKRVRPEDDQNGACQRV